MRRFSTFLIPLALLSACKKEDAPTPALKPVTDPASGIYLRASWTAELPDATRLKQMGPPTIITLCQEPAEVACLATELGPVGDYLEQMRKTARAAGMGDIPYHFAVDAIGRVWQLRPITAEGEHCRGNNAGNIGVLILGNPDAAMTLAQKKASLNLIQALWEKYGLPFNTSVVGRDEVMKGDLPGGDVKKMIGEIRGAQGVQPGGN